jgi:hypothetical protein
VIEALEEPAAVLGLGHAAQGVARLFWLPVCWMYAYHSARFCMR